MINNYNNSKWYLISLNYSIIYEMIKNNLLLLPLGLEMEGGEQLAWIVAVVPWHRKQLR
jgi:hypothetical protein